MEKLEGKRGAGEGGHRGEGGTLERGEKRGVLSPCGVWWGQEDILGVPWCGGRGNWPGPWHITPSTHLDKVQGWDQPGQEHHTPKPIKCSRGHRPALGLPPIQRSEESVLICCLLNTSDPALIPPKTFPESFQVAAGEKCP